MKFERLDLTLQALDVPSEGLDFKFERLDLIVEGLDVQSEGSGFEIRTLGFDACRLLQQLGVVLETVEWPGHLALDALVQFLLLVRVLDPLPVGPVEPIYIAGLFLTASRPSRIFISFES